MPALNTTSILIDHFLGQLEAVPRRLFGELDPDYPNAIRATGAMAMELIANSDALYHDVEHSMMVTLVGQEILRGKYLYEGSVTPRDWVHFIVSLLCHDIGYVRGICPGDDGDVAVTGAEGGTVEIPPGNSDAFLTAHHIERGKLFVRWRFKGHPLIDGDVIADNLEYTRFPVPDCADRRDNAGYPGLVRAADLIGQMADPDYLRKLPALFYEFAETGAHRRVGAESPEDLRVNYPGFYWKMVSPHVGPALRYLQVTREGQLWEAGLYSHIFSAAHRELL